MEQLTFLDSLTVEQFKAQTLVSKVQVRKNPQNGKLFFTFGAKTGAVRAKGLPIENPMFSYVKGTPTERNPTGEFWMLHEAPKGGATIELTL